jgi:hypothetical protein
LDVEGSFRPRSTADCASASSELPLGNRRPDFHADAVTNCPACRSEQPPIAVDLADQPRFAGGPSAVGSCRRRVCIAETAPLRFALLSEQMRRGYAPPDASRLIERNSRATRRCSLPQVFRRGTPACRSPPAPVGFALTATADSSARLTEEAPARSAAAAASHAGRARSLCRSPRSPNGTESIVLCSKTMPSSEKQDTERRLIARIDAEITAVHGDTISFATLPRMPLTNA